MTITEITLWGGKTIGKTATQKIIEKDKSFEIWDFSNIEMPRFIKRYSRKNVLLVNCD